MHDRDSFVVIDESDFNQRYSIRPEDIKVSTINTVGNFGKMETEEAAAKLVAFFQEKKAWVSFTLSELTEFFKSKGWDSDQMFGPLLGSWHDNGGIPCWRQDGNYLAYKHGRYCVTRNFIEHCVN